MKRDFTGQYRDDTGLSYYGARYYDPALGRFVSADLLARALLIVDERTARGGCSRCDAEAAYPAKGTAGPGGA